MGSSSVGKFFSGGFLDKVKNLRKEAMPGAKNTDFKKGMSYGVLGGAALATGGALATGALFSKPSSEVPPEGLNPASSSGEKITASSIQDSPKPEKPSLLNDSAPNILGGATLASAGALALGSPSEKLTNIKIANIPALPSSSLLSPDSQKTTFTRLEKTSTFSSSDSTNTESVGTTKQTHVHSYASASSPTVEKVVVPSVKTSTINGDVTINKNITIINNDD